MIITYNFIINEFNFDFLFFLNGKIIKDFIAILCNFLLINKVVKQNSLYKSYKYIKRAEIHIKFL